ncbi:hypothetical protein OESDEN_07116 [Oesophagostomum dentatum]|uniref:Uncharacterized protein n=1 Tax=Oesophagostomum dentatum TaxID=61180 RepID=A0A0B1T5X7_OESDE|nr:hypothetical protein OESDEN_07116 [Oesophagostomum dentatum]
MVFDGVLKEIADFFLSSPSHRENAFGLERVTPKIKTAIVQCNAAEVCRLVNGVVYCLQREIGEHMLIKSGHCSIQDVVNKFEDCGGKRKHLLVIEQAESLSSGFLNGLFYSLASLQCEIIVLLCVSTKQTMFTSRVSRRCLALLHTHRFLFSLSKEVFYNLLRATLLNPSFTDLRPHPKLVLFLRWVCVYYRV